MWNRREGGVQGFWVFGAVEPGVACFFLLALGSIQKGRRPFLWSSDSHVLVNKAY